MNKKVTILYFAILREQRGLSTETITTAAPDAAALYEELRIRHVFTLPAANVRVAINGDFAPWNSPLPNNAEIVFLPPVAGG